MPPKYFLNRNIEKIEQPCNHFLVIINILYYNGTFVPTNETTLIKYYELKSVNYSDLSEFTLSFSVL